jgi:predicted RNA-binding protein with PIN domain
MPWLVDGNNLLAQMPGRSMNDPAHRRWLASELSQFCESRRCHLTLYFDGQPLQGWRDRTWLGKVCVFHSGGGRTADAAILEEVISAHRPAELTVVTSDRALFDRCRGLGARGARVREFRRILGEAGAREDPCAEKPDRADPSEVAYFLEAFGSTDEGPPIRSRRRR